MIFVLKKFTIKAVFSIFFVLYLFFIIPYTFVKTNNVDYKNFDTSYKCEYKVSDMSFYDFNENNKNFVIKKQQVNSVFNLDSIKCHNKVVLIEDGWPKVLIIVQHNELFFQIIKNTGVIIIFILFFSLKVKNHTYLFSTLLLFLFTSYYLLHTDFKHPEFKDFYSYEIIVVEVIATFLIYLDLVDKQFLKKLINQFFSYFNNIETKKIIFISTLISLRAIYHYQNNFYDLVVSEWIINYRFGFIRRGLPGTVLLFTNKDLNFIANFTLPLIIFIIHFFVVFLTFRIVKKSHLTKSKILILFSPVFIMYPLFQVSKGVGNKEYLGLLCFLLFVLFKDKFKSKLNYIFFGIFYTITLFSHEINLIFFVFIISLYISKKYKFDKILFLILTSITFIFVSTYLFSNNTNVPQLLCEEIYLQLDNLDCSKSVTLEQGFYESVKFSINRIFEDLDYVIVYGTYLLLGLIPFLYKRWIQENKILIITLFIFLIPFFIISIDWGRWLHFILFCLSIIYLLDYEVNNSTETLNFYSVQDMLFLILYSTIWRVPQCCVEELNIVFLFRFNKFNFLFYILFLYLILRNNKKFKDIFLFKSKQKKVNKLN